MKFEKIYRQLMEGFQEDRRERLNREHLKARKEYLRTRTPESKKRFDALTKLLNTEVRKEKEARNKKQNEVDGKTLMKKIAARAKKDPDWKMQYFPPETGDRPVAPYIRLTWLPGVGRGYDRGNLPEDEYPEKPKIHLSLEGSRLVIDDNYNADTGKDLQQAFNKLADGLTTYFHLSDAVGYHLSDIHFGKEDISRLKKYFLVPMNDEELEEYAKRVNWDE
jgi:hypothetical protein